VLSNFVRDVPRELFESMRVDGAPEWACSGALAFPLTRPALVTVSIFNGPTVLASVVLTTLPILVLYAIGRRQLLGGLTAGFSK
jgi:raffinose/stachyose/melibiose transport system permease protein